MNTQIEDEDLLQALLDCFHLKDPWARITPKKQNCMENPFELWDKDQIQNTGTSIGDYIESPLRKINKHEFSARIWMVTSIPLYKITQDDTVQQWLQSERVSLEKNNLEKVDLVNVGFLTKINPRAESMSLSDLRLKALMDADNAQFHLIKSTIFPATQAHKSGQTNKSTQDIKAKVIMVRAASTDAHKIAEAMASITSEQTTFYPWIEYQSLTEDQKRTIVLEQENFLKQFRSFSLNYFTTAVNDTPMDGHTIPDGQTGNKGRRPQPDTPTKSTVTIQEFLQNHYKTGAGEPLFVHVQKPIEGRIEVIVDKDKFVEAQACIRKLNQDLQFFCNPKARAVIFADTLQQDFLNENYKPWQSFQLGKTIKATKKHISQMHVYQDMDNLQHKISHDINQNSNLKTYKEVTSKHLNRDFTTMHSLPTSELTFTTTAESNAVSELRQNVDEMQKSIKFLEQTITTQGKETKQEVVRLIAVSEKRQYDKFQDDLSFHTQTLMQQMKEISGLIQQQHKRPPTTPTKTRKYNPKKRANRTCSSPISIRYTSSDSDSEVGTVDSDQILSD